MTKNKKGQSILMVIERFHPLVGGAETQCLQISQALIKKGLNVSVVTKRWFTCLKKKEVFESGLAVFRVGLPRGGRFSDYFSGFSLLIFLIRNLKKFDIFYINGGLANIFGSTAIFFGKIFRKKVVAKVETPGELYFSGPKALSPKKFVHPLIKVRLVIAKKADFFIAQTSTIENELGGLSIPAKRIVFITNSVDINFFNPLGNQKEIISLRKRLGLPTDRLIISFCGRLVKRKGLVYLLEAWTPFFDDKATLLIIGSGYNQPDSVEEDLKKMVINKKWKNILFLGSKDKNEVKDLLRASDIFVYPSIHPEGTALSVLEAMSVGLPVLVTNVGGLNDVVENGIDGFVVKPKDSKDLANCLEKLVKDRQLRLEMGKKAREKVIENYANEIIVDEYQQFLKTL